MQTNHFNWSIYAQMPVVGIVRNMHISDFKAILPSFLAAGFNTIEVTLNTPGAQEMITYAASNYQGRLNVGAGTVCSVKDVELALTAGASFLVTPIVNKKVIKLVAKLQVPIFVGALTPTEVYKAWQYGATMVKIFPAGTLGAKYIKELKAPLHHIKLMPTGGVDIGTVSHFIQAGASALGIGSPLFLQAYINDGLQLDKLSEHFELFANTIKEAYRAHPAQRFTNQTSTHED